MYDVTALGELLIDFTLERTDEMGYPTLSAHPGGAPGNFLAALSAYGCRTAFLGKVGEDDFGRMLIKTLRRAGIETRGIRRDPDCFTTLAFVTLDETGNRSFSFARKPGADTQLRAEELDLALIDGARDFHFGTLSLTCDPARTATRKAVAYARQKGKLVSFDPNLRLPLWNDPEEAKAQILWGLEQADVVKISDEEIRFLWDCGPEAGAEKLLEDFGVKLVFATLGPDGCYFANGQARGKVSSPTGIHVVDTTGAGDIFGGSALSRVLCAGAAPDLLTEGELREITAFACTAASLSTQQAGGISSVPPFETVMARMARGM